MIERLDRELRAAETRARLACADPLGSDVMSVEYEYGRRIGAAQGLKMAIDIMVAVQRESNKRDKLL